MEDHPQKNTSGTWIQYAIIVLVAAFVFLLFFLVRDYRALRRAQVINARQMLLAAIVRDHGHLSVDSINQVRSWMTFDYLNELFGVPSDYLKGQLGITDPRYPRISLSSYAKSDQVSPETIVLEVEAALRTYLTNTTSTSATSTPN